MLLLRSIGAGSRWKDVPELRLGSWAWALWCREAEAGSRSGPPTPTRPKPSPPACVETCGRRGSRGWVRRGGCGREISHCPPSRVTGYLATCLLLARCPSRSKNPLTRPSPNTSSHPCSHAALQPVCVAWKSRSHGCPGILPDGERGGPAGWGRCGELSGVWWVCSVGR